jgi:membrane protein
VLQLLRGKQENVARERRSQRTALLGELLQKFGEHRLFIYATSIGFRALVALIPLALLALALLGALGLKGTWRNSVAPQIRPHVTPPVFVAIDYSAEKVLASGTALLILFASALVVWDLTLAVAAIIDALNRIHDVEEKRSFVRRAATALALALVSGTCLIGSILIVSVAPRARGDVVHLVLGIGRWFVAAGLLMFVVAVVMRFGPAERPEKRWASAGSLLIVVVWIVASLLFKLWVEDVADFKSATGSLTVLLFLSWYVFVSSSIFLVGAQLDELLRRETRRKPSRLRELIMGG